MESYLVGSPLNGLVQFFLLAFCGFFLGAVVYVLCSYPSTRREQFRVLGSSKRTGMLLGGIILVTFIAGAYLSCWMEFYQLDADNNSINLGYYGPRRTVTIPIDDIKSVVMVTTNYKGNWSQIIINTGNKKIYKSADVKEERLINIYHNVKGLID